MEQTKSKDILEEKREELISEENLEEVFKETLVEITQKISDYLKYKLIRTEEGYKNNIEYSEPTLDRYGHYLLFDFYVIVIGALERNSDELINELVNYNRNKKKKINYKDYSGNEEKIIEISKKRRKITDTLFENVEIDSFLADIITTEPCYKKIKKLYKEMNKGEFGLDEDLSRFLNAYNIGYYLGKKCSKNYIISVYDICEEDITSNIEFYRIEKNKLYEEHISKTAKEDIKEKIKKL